MNHMDQKQTRRIDSKSEGDPAEHQSIDYLVERLAALNDTPTDRGHVVLVVARGDGGIRQMPPRILFTPDGGVSGDAWGRQKGPDPEAQITVMQSDVAQLIANRQPIELFGDNLILSLDLSEQNLPVGSQIRAGECTLQVTPKPHNGCKKFLARFGADALNFVSNPGSRNRNLRGIYMCVVEGGEVGPGDQASVLFRASQER
jgi:MOSC domain-containing protein YiiM